MPIPRESKLFRRTRFGRSALRTDPIVLPQATRWSVEFGAEGNEGVEDPEVLYGGRYLRVSLCLDVWYGPR